MAWFRTELGLLLFWGIGRPQVERQQGEGEQPTLGHVVALLLRPDRKLAALEELLERLASTDGFLLGDALE